ncbi:hypothetical protein EKN06_04015 [Croceicoccus ponticola]|uniref:PilZ domain-containing protein n=1 Tax=Croceicoccus ponticola TaxID=2217664 RepID=A0A437H170_9SPHN|nr:hypothetical protein [Croceicoccus ponticola]RVQ69358.1 hypothetical protein EKN06_04015 [Croceicoccus ponticola]
MVNSRLADRVQVAANGSFRRGPGLAQIVNVVDLTPLGCRLLDISRNLSRGETISIRIGNFGPIAAHVRWLKLGREAGLEFAIPLPDAVFAILAGQDAVDPDHPYRAEIMALRNDFADVAPTGDASVPTDEEPARIHVDYEPEPVDIPQHAAAANDDPVITDQRATTRVAADDPAMCIDATRDAVAVRVIDFSREGMQLGHTGIDVAPGSRLRWCFPTTRSSTAKCGGTTAKAWACASSTRKKKRR